ncbi:hypothetical protein INT43_004795 [Umbelopsis isabellina]|uniref:Uncharacterized protein n=1 Tax=Mortierella isabellina TaxID=91625 RepID=A0A8H7UA89_MORIS|nr:hypothetical protein INT43_004795 [Umbelopsis isabellina]
MNNAAAILDIMNGFRRSKILFAAVKLGVFDALAQHQPRGLAVHELVTALPNQEFQTSDGLSRLLRSCVSLQLLNVDKQNRYSMTPQSGQFLVSSSRQSLAGYINHSNDMLYPLWQNLESSVQTGSTCWTESFGYLEGADSKKAFEHIYHGADGPKRFMLAMDAVVNNSAPQILDMVRLTWVNGVLDIGGGTGRLSSWICDAHPQCSRAIVLDLPNIVDLATEMRAIAPINEKVEYQKGDFKQAIPKIENDINAIVLSRILHDWDDETCLDLLQRIHQTLVAAPIQPAGVIICDMLFDDNAKISPVETNLQDCNMLVQTGGRERSKDEMKQLLEKSGFQQISVYQTGTLLDVVVAFCSI